MRLETQSVQHLNKFTGLILDAAITVHKEMGPGLLESVYHHCLLRELNKKNLTVESQVIVPLIFQGEYLNKDYVIDLLIENEIIIELKAIENILPIHEAQIISYMRLAKKPIGLLIYFNVPVLKQGFKRFVY